MPMMDGLVRVSLQGFAWDVF
jgi:hypothetical protein